MKLIMGSEQSRYRQRDRPKRWQACLGVFCFISQKGGNASRIAPASRFPEGNAPTAQPNGAQAGRALNQTPSVAPSLLAPPSSPASFTNSAIPSTAQSPSCYLSLSANSPGGPSSAMFATGPYAHETQLVSPPVFSTFTTEPSTAPLTPPPELAHLTTPSSPDVPYAHFLSSGTKKRSYITVNDLQTKSAPFPGSPSHNVMSPKSVTSSFTDCKLPFQWDSPRLAQDSNFFCPATFAQFYLDNNTPFPLTAGRISVSRDPDVHQAASHSRKSMSSKQDIEEPEAYRASFGFSADEIITAPQYADTNGTVEEPFTISHFPSTQPVSMDGLQAPSCQEDPIVGGNDRRSWRDLDNDAPRSVTSDTRYALKVSSKAYEDLRSRMAGNLSLSSTPGSHVMVIEGDMFSNITPSKLHKTYQLGLSCSDAEIEYKRGRSLREGKRDFAWSN